MFSCQTMGGYNCFSIVHHIQYLKTDHDMSYIISGLCFSSGNGVFYTGYLEILFHSFVWGWRRRQLLWLSVGNRDRPASNDPHHKHRHL